jgi:hypothetical protein
LQYDQIPTMALSPHTKNCIDANNWPKPKFEKFYKTDNIPLQNHTRLNPSTPTLVVVTLALGSWPTQGFARVRAKREARECERVWE